MDKNVIGKPVLGLQAQLIVPGIIPVSFSRVNVVGRKHDFLIQYFVIKHQQGTVEEGKLVVPKQMKDLRLGTRGVSQYPEVGTQHPRKSPHYPRLFPWVAVGVEEMHASSGVHLRTIHLSTTEHVH